MRKGKKTPRTERERRQQNDFVAEAWAGVAERSTPTSIDAPSKGLGPAPATAKKPHKTPSPTVAEPSNDGQKRNPKGQFAGERAAKGDRKTVRAMKSWRSEILADHGEPTPATVALVDIAVDLRLWLDATRSRVIRSAETRANASVSLMAERLKVAEQLQSVLKQIEGARRVVKIESEEDAARVLKELVPDFDLDEFLAAPDEACH